MGASSHNNPFARFGFWNFLPHQKFHIYAHFGSTISPATEIQHKHLSGLRFLPLQKSSTHIFRVLWFLPLQKSQANTSSGLGIFSRYRSSVSTSSGFGIFSRSRSSAHSSGFGIFSRTRNSAHTHRNSLEKPRSAVGRKPPEDPGASEGTTPHGAR